MRTMILFCLAAGMAWAATAMAGGTVEVKVGDTGGADVSVGGQVCVKDFRILLAAADWKFSCATADCRKEVGADARRVVVSGRMVNKGQEYARFQSRVSWDDRQVKLDYELTLSGDFEAEVVRLNGQLPLSLSAGKASWCIYRPKQIKTGLFPERMEDRGGDFSDWGFDWFGWVLPGDAGIRFTPGPGLAGMQVQDARRWRGDSFQVCWPLAGKGLLRQGQTFAGGLTITPLTSGEIAGAAFASGQAMLNLRAELTPEAGRIEARNLLQQERRVELAYDVSDEIGTPLLERREQVVIGPMGAAAREFAAAGSATGDYRIHVSASDAANHVTETSEYRFNLDRTSGPRNEISLDGDWDFMPLGAGELAFPPQGKWEKRSVPSTFSAIENYRAWYRRSFDVPAFMAGKRLKLRFMAVKFDAKVYVNGKLAGSHFGGFAPFEVDVTDLVRRDGPNELCVGVTGWVAACVKVPPAFTPKQFENPGVYLPPESMIAPVGTGWGYLSAGIWQEVSLVARPEVSVTDVFVKTSVRRHRLTAEITVRNEGAAERIVELRNAIHDRTGIVKTLPPRPVTVPPGRSQTVTLVEDWPDARLWSLDDPYLYQLRTTLFEAQRGPVDETATRFGFREVWTDGEALRPQRRAHGPVRDLGLGHGALGAGRRASRANEEGRHALHAASHAALAAVLAGGGGRDRDAHRGRVRRVLHAPELRHGRPALLGELRRPPARPGPARPQPPLTGHVQPRKRDHALRREARRLGGAARPDGRRAARG